MKLYNNLRTEGFHLLFLIVYVIFSCYRNNYNILIKLLSPVFSLMCCISVDRIERYLYVSILFGFYRRFK